MTAAETTVPVVPIPVSRANTALQVSAPAFVHVAWNGHGQAALMPEASLDAVTYYKDPPKPPKTLQARVEPWLDACFGPAIAKDPVERNHRFFEEATELVQACGCTRSEAHQLVDYVFGRAVGEKEQEVGGVMITLAALCLAQGLDLHIAAEIELARIWTKVEKIRAKQAAKPAHGPLPEHVAEPRWAHPRDDHEGAKRWLLIFDDKDRGPCVYYDEGEARTAYATACNAGWNCHLMVSATHEAVLETTDG